MAWVHDSIPTILGKHTPKHPNKVISELLHFIATVNKILKRLKHGLMNFRPLNPLLAHHNIYHVQGYGLLVVMSLQALLMKIVM